MMIKLKEKTECAGTSIEFDEYVPFSVRFECDSSMQPLYWRIGDGRYSLMEIGFVRETGTIQSITLVSMKKENIHLHEDAYPYGNNYSKTNCLPAFDLGNWNSLKHKVSRNFEDNFIDDFNLEFDLIIGKDYLSISFPESDQPLEYLKNNNVIFGIDRRGILANISIISIGDREMICLKSAV
ncbi:hypothetical protein [Vibrio tetraodonis]|uniref:hypothetical protein n=1 Tax=Vibrio tetraodonis TaxID=2231647 RepID=UPI000E0BFFB5|nr:hypothetical protein [Vibrio tetraodonis]